MRRALLIGSQTHGLVGVDNDLDRLGAALARYGFTSPAVVRGEHATREGILAAIRELIGATRGGDAALLYYTGHGGRVANPRHRGVLRDGSGARARVEPRFFQFIVPTDHTRDHFRGIFSAELSALLAELTAKTANVTTIFDCCHAARIVRGTYVPKALPPLPWSDDLATYLRWLEGAGYDLGAGHLHTNPNALNLFACAAAESAYEHTDDTAHSPEHSPEDGRPGGVLTTALVGVLGEAQGAAPTWRAIEALVTARVHQRIRAQNPVIAGPIGRRLFIVEETAETELYTYAHVDGHHLLRAGTLHGLKPGDRFLIMPLDASDAAGDAASDAALAEAEALTVGPHTAHLRVQRLPGRPPLPLGACARRHRPSPQGRPAPLDPGARADALLALRSGRGRAKLPRPPAVEWGLVDDGHLQPLPLRGAELEADARIYVKVTAPATARITYISILALLELGGSHRIRLLTDIDPHGVELPPGATYILGANELTGDLPGLPLTGSLRRSCDYAPAPAPAPTIALIIIASDAPVDLRPLESGLLKPDDLLPDGTIYRDFGDLPGSEGVLRYAITQARVLLRREANDPQRSAESPP